MAANAEPTVPQMEGFDWNCMRHTRGKKHPLGDRMYLIRRNGEALLYCEECAKKVKDDLNGHEAKDFEVFKRNITMNLECEEPCFIKGCKNKVQAFADGCQPQRRIFSCQQHVHNLLSTYGYARSIHTAMSLLQAKTYERKEDISCWRVVNYEELEHLKLDLTKLVLPEIPTNCSNHAVAELFQRILEKEIEQFKKNYSQESVTFTNVLHYCTLKDALFKLNALVNYPKECEMLEDTITSDGGAPTTMDENKDKKFTVGKGKHVSITVTENPEECEPFLFARGFNVIITGIEKDKVEYRLEVNFDLEMTEQTRWAASAGLHHEEFMIGYTHTTTKRCFCTEGIAIATPDDI